MSLASESFQKCEKSPQSRTGALLRGTGPSPQGGLQMPLMVLLLLLVLHHVLLLLLLLFLLLLLLNPHLGKS